MSDKLQGTTFRVVLIFWEPTLVRLLSFMRNLSAHTPLLLLGSLLVFPLASCSTNSNLSSFSTTTSANQVAVTETVSTTPAAESSDSIVGSPAVLDAVAQERPAQTRHHSEVKAPIVLASVPTTPVHHMPTNQIMMVRTTAYSHLEADSLPYGKKSAAGTTLQYGARVRSAAADWSKYPLGTRFMIEGLPYEYVVDDYGSALCGTETIDIYKPNMSGIGDWGVRNVPIRILEWGSFEESRKILDGRKHVRHANHVRKMLSEIEKKGKAGYRTGSSSGSA